MNVSVVGPGERSSSAMGDPRIRITLPSRDLHPLVCDEIGELVAVAESATLRAAAVVMLVEEAYACLTWRGESEPGEMASLRRVLDESQAHLRRMSPTFDS